MHADTSVDVHHAPTHVVSYNPDAPSEEWGWHGGWRDFAPKHEILLWIGVVGLVAMGLFGNHNMAIYDWWILAIAALMAGWIVWRRIAHRREVRRRL